MKALKYISLLLGVSSITLNATPFYLELKSGVCKPKRQDQISYKKAPSIAGELGYKLTDHWRLGLQVGFVQYVNKKVDNGTKHELDIFNHDNKDVILNARFTSIAGLVNIYYDFKIKDKVSFNVGVGGGLTKLKYHFVDSQGLIGAIANKEFNISKFIFCAQVMAGVTYDINDHWALSLGYRCMKMENLRYKHDKIQAANLNASLETPFLHSFELGLRYSF